MSMLGAGDFGALDALLNQPDECPLPNGGQPVAGAQGPGAIKAPMDTAIIPKPKGVEQTRTEIWDEDDIAADDGLQIDPSDTRLRPEYDILYKQDVSANVRCAATRWPRLPPPCSRPRAPAPPGLRSPSSQLDSTGLTQGLRTRVPRRTASWASTGRRTRARRAATRLW